MAVLSRPRFLPQQRLDLEDVNALLAALRTDSKLYTKQFLSTTNLIYKGFTVSGIGLKSATIVMADATLIAPENSYDFSWFTAAPAEPNITVPDASLTDNARNYLELTLSTQNNTPLTKAFWDPEANSGLGSEFNQIVNTVTDLQVNVVVSTGGFSGLPDRVPLAILDVDASGNIKTIFDRRNLFGRLAKPVNIDNRFSWGTKLEPTYSMTLTGVSGTFVAGETLTLNTETATCTTGGTSSIAFNLPTGINFFPGSTVTGGTSGATGTIATVVESFTGVDKNLKTQKDINDALMTEFALVKGTRMWWQDPASSIVGIVKFMESVLVQATATAAWSWDGTNLKITDNNVSPANDVLGYIRMMGRSGDLALTREDGTGGTSSIAIADGQVLFVNVPATGSRTYSGSGSGATNFQVVSIGSYVSSDSTYWLAYREGTRLYIRGYGEMEPGEVINIGDPELEDILATIAANLGSANQDRTLKLIEGGTWSVNNAGDSLTLSADAFIQIPGLLQTRNKIAAQTISLPNSNSVAYVQVNRTGATPATISVLVANENAITLGNDDVVIARRVSQGILVGSKSFLLKPNEYLELDAAEAEINRRLGQLQLSKHPSVVSKVKIANASATMLNSDLLKQVIGDFLLDFSGAVINFSTGAILKEDDSTALGNNFTPQTIPVGEYFWYGVSLVPDAVNADNTQQAKVQIDFAASSNAVQASAPKAVISGDIKLGEILVRNVGGTITVIEVDRLGVGSGSGSGSGDASSLDTILRDQFVDSNFQYLVQNIFRNDKATKIDGTSTGAFAPAKKAFGFTGVQTMLSLDMANAEFQAQGVDITELELFAHWLVGFIDTAATYEASRDGGTNWSTISMVRVGTASNAYRGYVKFADESILQNLDSVAATGAGSALNATTNQQLSSKLVLASTSVLRNLDLSLNYGGAGTGLVTLRIVKDNAGSPSTAVTDILSESTPKTISTASLGGTGNITVNFTVPQVVLTAGTYHIVLSTDSAYKAGTLDLSWRSAAGTDGGTFNGTTWTAAAPSKAHVAKGRVHNLRVRITSSATSYLDGYGVSFGLDDGFTSPTGQKNVQRFVFSGDANQTQFTLNWTPDPDLLEIFDVYRGQVYVVDNDTVRLSGQTITFDSGTFNFPGESILLIARQIKGVGIDNSDSNAAAISAHSTNLLDAGAQMKDADYVILNKINVPNTAIVNRAQIPDFANDLKMRHGADRIPIHAIFPIADETGSNNEQVFGVTNDRFGQIRLAGFDWKAYSGEQMFGASANGMGIFTTAVNDYIEFAFYGTGANLLQFNENVARSFQVTVDSSNTTTISQTTSYSNVINSRNYLTNIPINVASNLTLGYHTIRVAMTSGTVFGVCGIEILNESALIKVNPGSQYVKGSKRTLASLASFAPDASFESGTLGSKGGRVLVYQKADGSIAKALTPTDTTTLTGNSASHANEEPSRSPGYAIREFGAARLSALDDFSLQNYSGNFTAAFSLDDNSTNLFGSGPTMEFINNLDSMFAANLANSFFAFSFEGTGLDVLIQTSGARSTSISIDGGSAFVISNAGATKPIIQKIVSGLPYGQHTVRFSANAASTFSVAKFIPYRPKTPTLPTGAAPIGAYNLNATFVPNTAQGLDTIATGVIRKVAMREFLYVNGTGGTSDWVFTNAVVGGALEYYVGGFGLVTDRLNAYFEYTFEGTGFDLRWAEPTGSSRTTGALVKLNGTDLNASYPGASGINVSTYGAGVTFGGQAANSSYLLSAVASNSLRQRGSGLQNGNGFRVSNLPYGKYTIRVTNNVASQFLAVEALDVICPTSSPKANGPFIVGNISAVGNSSLQDGRNINKIDWPISKGSAYARNYVTSPSVNVTAFVPLAELSTIINVTEGNAIDISYMCIFSLNTAGQAAQFVAFVDGMYAGQLSGIQSVSSTGIVNQFSARAVIPVAKGIHKVDVYWNCNVGGNVPSAQNRSLTVREIKD